jgi:prepilin-type N-terminal cleavage/methylation domain-containing protein
VRAFTLLETMLALTISGIVVASATTATVSIYRSLLAKEQQADADDQARAVIDYVGGAVAKVGNDYVIPSAVIGNDCWSTRDDADTCVGRTLRFVELDPGHPQLELAGAFARRDDTSTPELPASVGVRADGSCPLVSYPATGLDVVLLPPYAEASPTPGTLPMGGGWLAARCVPNVAQGACACTLTPLRTPGLPDDAPAHLPHGAVATATPTYPEPATGWILAPGQVVTIWHDPATQRLYEARDLERNGVVVTRLLSDLVWEFRAQFAFESTATPGNLSAWFEQPEPRFGLRLRAIRLGVIAGARAASRTTPSSAQLFADDATPTATVSSAAGLLLRSASSTVLLRNTLRL